jgi:hypothetical protein
LPSPERLSLCSSADKKAEKNSAPGSIATKPGAFVFYSDPKSNSHLFDLGSECATGM